jgi:DNA polymerase-1
MAKSAEEKNYIALEVMQWADAVTQPDRCTVITDYFHGKIIRDRFSLYRLRKKMMKIQEYALDTEFSSLRIQAPGESRLVGVSICWGKYNNYYIPTGHLADSDEEQVSLADFVRIMKPVFARKNVRVIGHNLKAEFHILENHGCPVLTDDIFDTLVAVWNIDENNEVNLKDTVMRYYNYPQRHFSDLLLTIPSTTKVEFGLKSTSAGNASLVLIKNLAPYALDDTYWTWQIYLDIFEALEEEGILPYFFKRQMPYLRVLFTMERRGVKVDFERLREMLRMAEEDLEKLQYEIWETAGIEFNVGSDQQLAELLFGWCKQKPIYKINYEPILDPKTGEQAIYKSGKNKGELKWKEVKDKTQIVGYEDSGNKHLIEHSYKFPIQGTTESGQPSTSADNLKAILKLQYKRDSRKLEGQSLVKLILKYSRLEKLRGTYMEGLLQQVYSDGKIHGSFNQCGTTSGRLSASEPNLQNLPRSLDPVYEPNREKYSSEETYEKAYEDYLELKEEYEYWIRYEIRDVFIPDVPPADKDNIQDDEEVILAEDYSNLEMRILTHFSQDPLLISMFEREADAHGDTAVNMYKLDCTADEAKKQYPKQRQAAKTINFLLVYGGSAFALSGSLDCTKEEAQVMYDLYFETYKGVKKYMSGQRRYGHQHEHVYTLLGRKRHLDGINSNDFKIKGYFERLAVNAPIQGSAADIAISAQLLIENDKELRLLGYRQIMQVHDEIVGVVPFRNVQAAAERKKYLMENCLPKPLNNVKLRADYDWGYSYAAAK